MRFLCAILLAGTAFATNSSNYTYLALGDSIAYGYSPLVTTPNPALYVGYPEILAGILPPFQQARMVNAACPGQTSTSYLTGGADNGCQQFKSLVGLHNSYSGTQSAFAVQQLQSNKHISLVTLGIGGDDLILLELSCQSAANFQTCIEAALPGVLQTYGANLTQILTEIRVQAGYTGNLVLMKYTPVNTDPLFTETIAALNSVMATVGAQFGAKIADGFTAFEIASALKGGDPCAAGLLVRLSATTCDVHPSQPGQDVLAATVLVSLAGGLSHF